MMVNEKFVLVVFIFALAGVILPITTSTTSTDIAFEIVHNYTNLADVRTFNTTYYVNESSVLLSVSVWSNVPKYSISALIINATTVSAYGHYSSNAPSIVNYIYIIPKNSYYQIYTNDSSNLTINTWYEHPILTGRNGTLSINQTNIYQNGTGGNGTTDHRLLTNLSWSLANHTIDSDVDFNNNSIYNISVINNSTYISSSSTDLRVNRYLYTPVDDYYSFLVENREPSRHTLVAFQTEGDERWPYFFARRATGNSSFPGTPQDYDTSPGQGTLFRFSASGWDGSAWTGSRSIIDMVTSEQWNATRQGTKILIWNTQRGTVYPQIQLTLHDDGKLQLNKMTGAGNAHACFNSTGYIYRGTLTGC